MALYAVDVETTYHGVVLVEADSPAQAQAEAARGPAAWVQGARPDAEEHLHTDAHGAQQTDNDNTH